MSMMSFNVVVHHKMSTEHKMYLYVCETTRKFCQSVNSNCCDFSKRLISDWRTEIKLTNTLRVCTPYAHTYHKVHKVIISQTTRLYSPLRFNFLRERARLYDFSFNSARVTVILFLYQQEKNLTRFIFPLFLLQKICQIFLLLFLKLRFFSLIAYYI